MIIIQLYLQLNMKQNKEKRLKVLNPRQMLQRSPIALALVKAGKTSENQLNEIRQILHYWYQAREITKKVYKHIMNPIKV